MKFFCGLLTLGCLVLAGGLCAQDDNAKNQAIKKDRKIFVGTWRFVSLEINGNKLPEEDVKKMTIINGEDGTWSYQVEGKDIMKGTSQIDPTKKPKTIDFTPIEGEDKDKEFKGIYEIEAKSRKMCFAKPGNDRPTEFLSMPGSDLFLLILEREDAK